MPSKQLRSNGLSTAYVIQLDIFSVPQRLGGGGGGGARGVGDHVFMFACDNLTDLRDSWGFAKKYPCLHLQMLAEMTSHRHHARDGTRCFRPL